MEGDSATGCAIASFDCIRRVLEVLVVHNKADAVSAQALRGDNTLFPLPRGASPIFMSRVLRPREEETLYQQQLRLEVLDADGDVLEGTLNTEYDFYAYLTGSQVCVLCSVGRVSSACGLSRVHRWYRRSPRATSAAPLCGWSTAAAISTTR